MSDNDLRAQSAAMLRIIADLIEGNPGVPLPKCDITFSVIASPEGTDVPALVAAITAAFPGPWEAEMSRSREYSWLGLATGVPMLAPGVRLQVSASAKDVCTESGTRTVTTWKPVPAIADLIEGEAEFDA